MARRQATILKYVDFRFRPQVRVTAEDPGGEGARSTADELDARIEAWVKDLRAAAEVRYNVGQRVPAPPGVDADPPQVEEGAEAVQGTRPGRRCRCAR